MDLISIIVPIYNVENYLKECIDSILNQSYSNIEIILVDDGSPDRSGAIIDEYSETDERIKTIHKPNGGLSSARNAGLDIATGDYIVFIDSDDLIHPSMLKVLYDVLLNSKSDVSYCTYEKFTDSKSLNISAPKDYAIKTFSQNDFWNEWAISPYCIVVWNKLYKKSIFNELRFEEGVIHEDVFIFHKWVDQINQVAKVDVPLYFYRQREGSIMTTKLSIKNMDVIQALADRTEYLLEKKWQSKAEFTMIDAMSRISSCYYLKRENKDRYTYLIGICKKENKKVMKSSSNKKYKILCMFFSLHPKFYSLVTS